MTEPELCLCKLNFSLCIHSPFPEWLLQECKSYLEGLLVTQQPKTLSNAGLLPVPDSRLGSSYSEGHKIKVGKVRTQNGILVFHMQNQSFCSNLSAPIILGIGTRAGDFTKCKCRGVQNEKVQVRAVFVPVEPNNSRYVVIQTASEHPCVDTRHHLSVWEGK